MGLLLYSATREVSLEILGTREKRDEMNPPIEPEKEKGSFRREGEKPPQVVRGNVPGRKEQFLNKRFYCQVYVGDMSSEAQLDSAADISMFLRE